MKSYKVWNRQDNINGVQPSHFLSREPFKNYNGDIILIYADNGKVSNVECNDILASVYGIDPTIDIDSFMEAYFAKLEETREESIEDENN